MSQPPTTHLNDQTLAAYSLGEIDPILQVAVEAHLSSCNLCRRRATDWSGSNHGSAPGLNAPLVPSLQSLARSSTFELGVSMTNASTERSIPADLPPELVDHPDYAIVRELGRGGMGVVYLVENRLMGRKEVLKIVGAHLVKKKGVLDRFLREIRAAAQLNHGNIVTAFAASRLGDSVVFSMEYVEGWDLAKLVDRKGPLAPRLACLLIQQAASALQHAHERGMVHRDVKPSNLMVTRDGRRVLVKVLDFGLAKFASETSHDGRITHEGQMLGTPYYVSPEQSLNARLADIRADVYSLGCTLYHLLTGRPPFQATSLLEMLQAHQSAEAPPVDSVRPDIPRALALVVARMLAKNPNDRFQTPKEVARALEPFLRKDFVEPKGVETPPTPPPSVRNPLLLPTIIAASAIIISIFIYSSWTLSTPGISEASRSDRTGIALKVDEAETEWSRTTPHTVPGDQGSPSTGLQNHSEEVQALDPSKLIAAYQSLLSNRLNRQAFREVDISAQPGTPRSGPSSASEISRLKSEGFQTPPRSGRPDDIAPQVDQPEQPRDLRTELESKAIGDPEKQESKTSSETAASRLMEPISLDQALEAPDTLQGREFDFTDVFLTASTPFRYEVDVPSGIGLRLKRRDGRTVSTGDGGIQSSDTFLMVEPGVASQLEAAFRELRLKAGGIPNNWTLLRVRAESYEDATVFVVVGIEVLGGFDPILVAQGIYDQAFSTVAVTLDRTKIGHGDGPKWVERLGGDGKFTSEIRRRVKEARKRMATNARVQDFNAMYSRVAAQSQAIAEANDRALFEAINQFRRP